jgi:hypothetical protein
MNVAHHHAQNLPFTVLLVNAANLYIRLIDKIHFINQNLLKLCVTAVTVPFMLFLYPIFWLMYRFLYKNAEGSAKIQITSTANYVEIRTKYDHLSSFLNDNSTLYIRALKCNKQPFYIRPLLRLLQKMYYSIEIQQQQIKTALDDLNPKQNTIDAFSAIGFAPILENEFWANKHPLYDYKV